MWANRSICSYSDFNLTRIMQSLYYASAGRYIISIVPIEGAVLFELILTLLMWQNFNTKQGTQKTGRYVNPQHTFFTKFCTKELSSLRILSSLHKATDKVAYCYDVNQSKFYLKSVHFITIQHKLSRAFQTDMHNKIT